LGTLFYTIKNPFLTNKKGCKSVLICQNRSSAGIGTFSGLRLKVAEVSQGQSLHLLLIRVY
jgi:hypothetical protein